jgi:Rod binding domain-containing protein
MTTVPPVSVPLSAPSAAKSGFETQGEALKSFEAIFLSQVVDEMMKTVDIDATMGAHSAEMWRSVLSQALADGLMENGGLGIAESIESKMNAYKVHAGGKDE